MPDDGERVTTGSEPRRWTIYACPKHGALARTATMASGDGLSCVWCAEDTGNLDAQRVEQVEVVERGHDERPATRQPKRASDHRVEHGLPPHIPATREPDEDPYSDPKFHPGVEKLGDNPLGRALAAERERTVKAVVEALRTGIEWLSPEEAEWWRTAALHVEKEFLED